MIGGDDGLLGTQPSPSRRLHHPLADQKIWVPCMHVGLRTGTIRIPALLGDGPARMHDQMLELRALPRASSLVRIVTMMTGSSMSYMNAYSDVCTLGVLKFTLMAPVMDSWVWSAVRVVLDRALLSEAGRELG
nr:hypothetical protein CFP56_37329 [Quercus suber]